MTTSSVLLSGMQKIIDRAGAQIRVQYFTSTTGSIYDDDLTYTQSGGDLWTSGVIFPLSNKPGHSDMILLEQGRLIEGDSKLFVHGSLVFLTGSITGIKITIGSPVTSSGNYTIIPPGPVNHFVSNTPIYKVVYIRQIGDTGSLLGE